MAEEDVARADDRRAVAHRVVGDADTVGGGRVADFRLHAGIIRDWWNGGHERLDADSDAESRRSENLEQRVFEEAFDLGEELGALGAVGDAVIG